MLITSLIHSNFSFSANTNVQPVTLDFETDLGIDSSSTQAFFIESSGGQIVMDNLAVIEEVESGGPERFLADDPNEVAAGDGNVKILNPGEKKTETVHILSICN